MMKTKVSSPSPQVRALRKLALSAFVGLGLCYGLVVAAGYGWLHLVRKNEQVGVLDVALFRLAAVRRGIAVQQFARAKGEEAAKNFQAAYLFYSSGVRNDPDNIPGRLASADFLRAVGAVNLAVNLLEDGLVRAPDDRRLIEAIFDLCTGTGRDRHALDLLHRHYGTTASMGANRLVLQTYEVQATLAADGAGAAKRLLDQHPELATSLPSTPVVARVLWESAEKLNAIRLLDKYLSSQPQPFAVYVQLARWQEGTGMSVEAVRTAERAIAQFPREIPPRALLIELLSPQALGLSHQWRPEIESYLRDFAGRPEAVPLLAEVAGRKGWVELAHTLYEVAANQPQNLSLFALYYGDALMQAQRLPELAQLEVQAPEGNTAFLVQLRQRQVIAAAALGDHDNVREFTRRLATTLHGDPDALDACRHLFQKLGVMDAVAELTGRIATAKTTAKK